jgi:hypothetical protein
MKYAVVLLALLVTAETAHAECLTASGLEIDEESAKARVDKLESSLDGNRKNMRLWNGTWFAVYTTTAVAQGVFAAVTDDEDLRVINTIGGIKSAIAAAAIPIIGVKTRRFKRTGDTCADLTRAEAVLAENVRLHAKGRKWLKHAGVVALNGAQLLVMGLGYDLWVRGAVGAGIGLVVGEIQIYTQPMGSRKLLRDYQRGDAPSGVATMYIAPSVTDNSVGVSLYGLIW